MEIQVSELREVLSLALDHIADLYNAETQRMLEVKALLEAGVQTSGSEFEQSFRAYLTGEAANSFRDQRSFGFVKLSEALQLLKP